MQVVSGHAAMETERKTQCLNMRKRAAVLKNEPKSQENGGMRMGAPSRLTESHCWSLRRKGREKRGE